MSIMHEIAGPMRNDSASQGLDDYLESLISRSSVFRDRDALRHDYLPSSLPHRDQELRHIGEILAPLLMNKKSSNALIYGKTGTGKTASIKLTSNIIAEKAKARGLSFIVSYANCRLEGTEYRTLAVIADSLGLSVPFTGLATNEVFKRITDELRHSEMSSLIILDEIDVLVKSYGDDLLYELTRMNETLPKSRVAIVAISNDLSFKEYLDPRVLSSLSEEEVIFKPYTADELRDILQARVSLAFNDGAVSDEVVNLVAALSASEHGDARRALNLLRVAGEIAERRASLKVTTDDVREALVKIEEDQIFEVCRSLPLHSKLLLAVISSLSKKNKTPTSGEVFGSYKQVASRLNLPELTYRRIAMLLNELEMVGLIESKTVNMGRHGRTRKMRFATAVDPVKRALQSDVLVAQLLE